MKIKIVVLAGLFSLSVSTVFAGWGERPEFRWTQFYRYDLRHDNYQLYTNRLSLTFDYLDKSQEPLLKLIPFFEIRRNIDKDIWERKGDGD